MLKFFLGFLLFLLLSSSNNSQQLQIPYVACPKYFQYFIDNSQYIGKISLPPISSTIELLVYFSQRQPLQANNYGRILLESMQPIVYRVEFPSASEVPKLTKITVNGRDICRASGYPAPSTRLLLNHKLQINTQALSSYLPQISTQQYPYNRQTLSEYPITYTQAQPIQDVVQFKQRQTPYSQTQSQYSQTQSPYSQIQAPFRQTQEPFRQTQVPFRQAQVPFIQTNAPVRQTEAQILNRFEPTQTALQTVSQNNECGLGTTISAFVFGGDEVMRGEFPWLTAIYVKSAGLRFLCGGSLVSSRTVVSAGHCFKIGSVTASRLVVNLGKHNLEDFSGQGFVTREIENLIVHPEYSTNLFPDADLAVLHLKQPVQFSNIIRPICLWTDSTDSRLIVGKSGVIAGWGADEQGRTFTPVPKKVSSKIVSDSECLRSSPAYNMLTSPRTFCAGNRDDTGPCMGDSGSGLMISRNGRWYLRGVVSAGQTKDRKCDLLEFVVFCDVAKHMQWLQSNLI